MDNRKDVTMIPKFRVWDKNVKVLRPVDFIDLQKQIVTYHISDLTISAIHLKKYCLDAINRNARQKRSGNIRGGYS